VTIWQEDEYIVLDWKGLIAIATALISDREKISLFFSCNEISALQVKQYVKDTVVLHPTSSIF